MFNLMSSLETSEMSPFRKKKCDFGILFKRENSEKLHKKRCMQETRY